MAVTLHGCALYHRNWWRPHGGKDYLKSAECNGKIHAETHGGDWQGESPSQEISLRFVFAGKGNRLVRRTKAMSYISRTRSDSELGPTS